MRPIASGRPGRMATRQNSTSPSSAMTCLVWSASPTLTPPEVITASADAAAMRKASASARGSSRTTPMSIGSAPRRCSIAHSV